MLLLKPLLEAKEYEIDTIYRSPIKHVRLPEVFIFQSAGNMQKCYMPPCTMRCCRPTCAPEDLLSHQAVANDSPTGMTPPLEAMDAPDGLEHSALMTVHISAYHRREAAQWCIKNGNGTPRNTCAPSGARFFGALCHLWLYTSITPQETTGVLRRVFGRWENRTEKSRPGAIHGFLAYPAVRLTVVASAFRSEIGTPFGKRDACERKYYI